MLQHISHGLFGKTCLFYQCWGFEVTDPFLYSTATFKAKKAEQKLPITTDQIINKKV